MDDVFIVRTLHAYPNGWHDPEWIEWPPYSSPVDAEWKAKSMMEDFPGIVTDYLIIRRETVTTDHVWGRYGDEHSRG